MSKPALLWQILLCFQIKLRIECILTAFQCTSNHKTKEEMVVNLQPFQKGMKGSIFKC